MAMIYSVNQTSACLLVQFAQKIWLETDTPPSLANQQRYLMVHDLYIKARSYSLINKVAFWFALFLGIAVVLWPAISIFAQDFGWEKEFLKSAIVQTTVTAFAGLTFAIYGHYKKRQLYIENIMRSLIYASEWNQSSIDRVLREMGRIDAGFGFSDVLDKKETEQEKSEREKLEKENK